MHGAIAASPDNGLHLNGNDGIPDADVEIDLAAPSADVAAEEARPATTQVGGRDVLAEATEASSMISSCLLNNVTLASQ